MYIYLDVSGEGQPDGEGIGVLRSLVRHYIAANALLLSFEDGFMGLLDESG